MVCFSVIYDIILPTTPWSFLATQIAIREIEYGFGKVGQR